MTTSVRDKIIALLGAGVSQTVAAEAAGVSDGYVSQLLLLPEVIEEVAKLKAGKLEGYLKIDNTIEEAEKLALEVTVKKLPFAKVGEAAKIFGIMNAARKKATQDAGGNANGGQQVTLILPRAAKVMVTINPDNQIIEVDGRSTAPLPSKVLPLMQQRMLQQQTTGIPAISPVDDVREKMRVADTSRANAVLADLTTTLDGVEIVI